MDHPCEVIIFNNTFKYLIVMSMDDHDLREKMIECAYLSNEDFSTVSDWSWKDWKKYYENTSKDNELYLRVDESRRKCKLDSQTMI